MTRSEASLPINPCLSDAEMDRLLEAYNERGA
jgi:hypothetical protein